MIYVIRSSEDGIIGATHNARRAAERAIQYVEQSGRRAALPAGTFERAGSLVPHTLATPATPAAVAKALREDWIVTIYTDRGDGRCVRGTTCDIEAFEAF